MAWTDEPSKAQLDTIYNWLSWVLPENEANSAVDYLSETATRKEVFTEIGRLKKLKEAKNLNKETCFASDIWENYKDE